MATTSKKKAAAAALFGGKAAPKKSTSKPSGTREVVQLPDTLRKEGDVFAAYRVIKTALTAKAGLAEKKLMKFMTKFWCDRFAATRTLPAMTTFQGDEGQIDFVVTERISITAEKQEALEMLGVDLTDWTETSGVQINVEALQKYGLFEKMQDMIAKLVTNEDQLAEIFTPQVTTKKGILAALPVIAEASEAEGSLADKIHAIVEILEPTAQKRNPVVEGKSRAECFTLVDSLDLPKKEKKAKAG